MLKLTTVVFVALLSLSPPPSQEADIEALKREVAALKAQQAAMQRDLQAIVTLLKGLAEQQAPAEPEVAGLVGATIPLDGEPTKGERTAKVTVVEVSDYHCPFCRRSVQQTLPQLEAEYISTGRIAYTFVDYPIAELHPDAFKSHEAAACAADQGKYWEMHDALFADAPVKDADALAAKAAAIGLDTGAFSECLASGRHAAGIRDSVSRIGSLGIGGTPMTLIGMTPAPGQPMTIVKYVYGARPYPDVKAAIDAVLAEHR